MTRAKLILMRILILLFAIAAPVGVVVAVKGPPAAYDRATLEAWVPYDSAGPSARLLTDGVTRLAGPERPPVPDWFGPDDQDLLAKAKASWDANKLQAGLGHLMVLSSHLEDQGKTLKDFLPLVAPDVANWLVSTYFAPLLLGVLIVVLLVVVFLPWLFRRLVDVLKVALGLAAAIAAVVGIILVCLWLPSKSAMAYSLVEYLSIVVVLTIIGNGFLLFRSRRRSSQPARAVAQVPAQSAAALESRRERPSALPSSYLPPPRSRQGSEGEPVAAESEKDR